MTKTFPDGVIFPPTEAIPDDYKFSSIASLKQVVARKERLIWEKLGKKDHGKEVSE